MTRYPGRPRSTLPRAGRVPAETPGASVPDDSPVRVEIGWAALYSSTPGTLFPAVSGPHHLVEPRAIAGPRQGPLTSSDTKLCNRVRRLRTGIEYGSGVASVLLNTFIRRLYRSRARRPGRTRATETALRNPVGLGIANPLRAFLCPDDLPEA